MGRFFGQHSIEVVAVKNVKNRIYDLLFYTVGCFVYAASVIILMRPNGISPGGLTGIATLLNTLVSLPIGLGVILLNIPIFIVGFISLGGEFLIKTAIATVISSVALDLCGGLLTPYSVDGILAAVFGGILSGFGLGLVMLRGATTGGVDIIAKLINRKWQYFSIGRCILIMDGIVVLLSIFVYKSLQNGMYTVISIYTASKIMDAVIYGAGQGKFIYIVTENRELEKIIMRELKRGVTRINAVGAYTGNDKLMLLCAVRQYEIKRIINIVKANDKGAFTVVTNTAEIMGEGFISP